MRLCHTSPSPSYSSHTSSFTSKKQTSMHTYFARYLFAAALLASSTTTFLLQSVQAIPVPLSLTSPNSPAYLSNIRNRLPSSFPYYTPDGPASAPILRAGQVVNRCTAPNSYAIAFDDAPGQLNDELLDYLKDQHLQVTFFMGGDVWSCVYHPESQRLLKRAFNERHQIALNPWHHHDLESLSDLEIRKEIERMEDAFRQILGVVPRYMRPPFGEHSERVRKVLEELGYVLVLWDVDVASVMITQPVADSVTANNDAKLSTLENKATTSQPLAPVSGEKESSLLLQSTSSTSSSALSESALSSSSSPALSSPASSSESSDDIHTKSSTSNSPLSKLRLAAFLHQQQHEQQLAFASSSKWAEAIRGVPSTDRGLDRDALTSGSYYQEASSVWAVESAQSMGLRVMTLGQCLNEGDARNWYKEIVEAKDSELIQTTC